MQHAPPSLPTSPPTAPGDMPPPRQSWPTAIGILAIVFGGLGALASMASIVGAALQPVFAQSFSQMPADTTAMFDVQRRYMPLTIALHTLMLLAAAALIAGGILLLKRRPVARPLLLAWSCTKLVLALAMGGLTFMVQSETMEVMAQQAAMPLGATAGMAIFSAVMPVLFSGAPALFVLIWFCLPKIRADVQSWRTE